MHGVSMYETERKIDSVYILNEAMLVKDIDLMEFIRLFCIRISASDYHHLLCWSMKHKGGIKRNRCNLKVQFVRCFGSIIASMFSLVYNHQKVFLNFFVILE